MVAAYVFLLLGAYVLGALPFTIALSVAHGIDPSEGDLHVALWYRASPLYAVVAGLVDVAKGAFPVLIGFGFSMPVWVVSFAGVLAVVGQMWPPLRGCGENGNNTGVGALIVLLLAYQAYAGLLCLGFFAVGAALRCKKILSMADVRGAWSVEAYALPLVMLAGFVSAPFFTWVANEPAGLTQGLALVLLAIVVRRLTSGLRSDMSVGARIGPVLVRRLLFDRGLVTDEM
ncbi:MAG: glycerol-3-phosphate acyltransferase [Chloroflexota bacterium]